MHAMRRGPAGLDHRLPSEHFACPQVERRLTTPDAGRAPTPDQRATCSRSRRVVRAQDAAASIASPASPTPLADEQRVVVYFGSLGLLCYDHEGRELWTKHLPTPKSTYGTASSPIRVRSTAVVVLDSNASTSPGSAQYQFLDQDLAASAKTWKFVFFHHPAYAAGSADSEADAPATSSVRISRPAHFHRAAVRKRRSRPGEEARRPR